MECVSTVSPVFIKTRDIPDNETNRLSVLEMCIGAEKVSGAGSILGAQTIRGLWRIYPTTKEGRTELLIKGVRLRGTVIQVSHTNPFVLREASGEEKPTTKLWIDNLPISVADSEIEHSLSKIGCELRSKITMEKARDNDKKLTRFLTGRRFVFISIPPAPLDPVLNVSAFNAKLYHREQKIAGKPATCSRCLKTGHHVSQCDGEVVCRQCGQTGHKQGSPQCLLDESDPISQADQITHSHPDMTEVSVTNTNNKSHKAGSPAKGSPRSDFLFRKERGRTSSRQTTIIESLERSPRERSATPKRRRSCQRPSPGQPAEKLQRRGNGQRTENGAETCVTSSTPKAHNKSLSV